MLCHYVTRSLTRPWEVAGGRLRYFDFGTGRIESGLTKDLFAVTDLNSQSLESRINHLVERPLAQLRARALQQVVSPTLERRVFRAAHLFILMQAARYEKAQQRVARLDRLSLDEVMMKPEAWLDGLAAIAAQHATIALVPAPDGQAMFLPETGHFSYPMPEMKQLRGIDLLEAVPLTPFLALVYLPRNADMAAFETWQHPLGGFSVGFGRDERRVVIPPELFVGRTESELSDLIVQARKNNERMLPVARNVAALTRGLAQSFGIQVEPPALDLW